MLWGEVGTGITKGYEENFEIDGYVHCFGYDNDFTDVYICQNVTKFTC